jgi:hypothetical protein
MGNEREAQLEHDEQRLALRYLLTIAACTSVSLAGCAAMLTPGVRVIGLLILVSGILRLSDVYLGSYS